MPMAVPWTCWKIFSPKEKTFSLRTKSKSTFMCGLGRGRELFSSIAERQASVPSSCGMFKYKFDTSGGGHLRQESEIRVGSILGTDGRARRGDTGEDTLNVQVCVCVDQLSFLDINQETKVSQDIGTKDGLLYISDDEYPR